MIIVRILGGLGNQMFQYAYAKSLQQKGFDVQLDISSFKSYKLHGGYQLDKFNIDLKYVNNTKLFFKKINILNTKKEKNLLFNKTYIDLKGSEYVKGYFQTENYFLDIRNTILEQFSVETPLSKTTKNYKTAIESYKISCSIHIRRGDYITDENSNKIHGTCSLNYYKEAVNIITNKYKNVAFFVFSDDISWTKKNLKLENTTYVEHKTIPHEDMYLMSLCSHNITANSSFSWWGAWLNRHKNKTIIAPKKWFVHKQNEVACKSWIKI